MTIQANSRVADLTGVPNVTERALNALVAHLQDVTESKDTALAYELHDELGALMGAAIMDLDAIRRSAPPLSEIALERLDRVKRTLQQAIDLKRRVIEELRPSILDNFGLCAALRWQLKRTWANSNVISTEAFPAVEPQFESHAAITLFRVAQGALSIALKRASVKSTDLTVGIEKGSFSMRFSDDGTSNAAEQTEDPAMILAAMRHRIRVVGGNVELSRTEAGATVLTASMPFSETFIARGD
jgi:signal transduction histidine kinase